MTALAERPCAPLPPGTPPLDPPACDALLAEVGGAWTIADGRLATTCAFPDFAQALAFTNRVGALAEAADHHPDIFLTWGRVEIVLWTHSVGGLSINDFILAARIEQVR